MDLGLPPDVRHRADNTGEKTPAHPMGWAPPFCNGIYVPDWRSHHQSKRKEPEMNVTRLGLDLAKNVFQIHGVDRDERVVVKRKCTRRQVHDYFEKLPPCWIGMAAA